MAGVAECGGRARGCTSCTASHERGVATDNAAAVPCKNCLRSVELGVAGVGDLGVVLLRVHYGSVSVRFLFQGHLHTHFAVIGLGRTVDDEDARGVDAAIRQSAS